MTGAIDRRKARDSDIPFLLALRQETMQAHLAASGASTSSEHHRARVMHAFEYAEILLLDGAPAGLLKLRRGPGAWEIIQLQLAPALQGKGVGRQLLEYIISEASAAGAGLRLSVLKANPARRLYERLGFTVVGEDDHEFHMQRALR